MTPFNGFDELENVVSGRKVKLGKSISGQSKTNMFYIHNAD